MNKKLSEALTRQRFRRIHKLATRSILSEQEHNLYTTFVQPFTDIIDAAKLTGQDILNSLRLSFDLLFAFTPGRMEKAMARFDGRKAKIEEKWKPVMERTKEALANEDISVMALVFAPELFLASEALAAGYKGAKSMNQYLIDSGWKIPFASMILGGEPEKTPPGGGGGGEGTPEKPKNLLQKLMGLFYFEGAWHSGDLILEQEEESVSKKPPFKKAMKTYLEQTGLSAKFAEAAEEMLEAQKEYIDEVLDEALPRLKLTSVLTQATTVDEFIAAIETAQNEGLDLKAAGLDQIRVQVDDATTKLMQSEDFKAKTAGVAGGGDEGALPPQISDNELRKAAEKVAFVNAKQAFDKEATSGKQKLVDIALAELDKELPKGANLAALKKSPSGIRLLKLFEDAKQKIIAA